MALQLFKIGDVTVASPQASIEFTSIPSGYTDLMLVVSARSTLAQIFGGGNMIFNDDSTAGNYTATKRLYGDGANVDSSTYNTNQIDGTNYNGNSATSNVFGSRVVYIPNYTANQHKSVSIDEVTENNATTAYLGFFVSTWKSNSAITKISLRNNSNVNFMTNSTATLYGVL